MSEDLVRILKVIEKREIPSQRRIHVMAAILRDLLCRPDEEGVESHLAFLLVLAELENADVDISAGTPRNG